MTPVKILVCALVVVTLPTTVSSYRKTIEMADLEEKGESLGVDSQGTLPVLALGETPEAGVAEYLVDVTSIIKDAEKAPDGEQDGVKCCCDSTSVSLNQDWFDKGRSGRCVVAQSQEKSCSKMPSPEWAGGRGLRHYSNSQSKTCNVHTDDLRSLFETYGSPTGYCGAMATDSASVTAGQVGAVAMPGVVGSARWGQPASIKCKMGYHSPNAPKCQYGTPAAGAFSPTPTCVWKEDWCEGRRILDEHYIGRHERIGSYSPTAYGKITTVVCDAGYHVPMEVSHVSNVCGEDGSFSPKPKCEAIPDFCAAVVAAAPSELSSSSSSSSSSNTEPSTEGDKYIVNFVGNSQVRKHTAYSITVTSPNGDTWDIQKRYTDFLGLDDRLRLEASDARSSLPTVPGKKYFGSLDPKFIAGRQALLQEYIEATLLLCAPEGESAATVSSILIEFLGGDQQGKEQTQEMKFVKANAMVQASVEAAAVGERRRVSCPPGFKSPESWVTCTSYVGEDGSGVWSGTATDQLCSTDEFWCPGQDQDPFLTGAPAIDAAPLGEYQDVLCAEGFQPSEVNTKCGEDRKFFPVPECIPNASPDAKEKAEE